MTTLGHLLVAALAATVALGFLVHIRETRRGP